MRTLAPLTVQPMTIQKTNPPRRTTRPLLLLAVGFSFMIPLLVLAQTAQAKTSDEGLGLHMPSSLSINASSSSDQTRSLALDAGFSTANNTQISAGYTRTNLELNGDAFSFNEFRFGAGTDPLNDFSGSAEFTGLVNGSDTQQFTLGLELMWSPDAWILTLTPSAGSIATANRPNIVDESSKITVQQTSLELSAEYFLPDDFLSGFLSGFSIRAFGVSYSYDTSKLNYINKAAAVSQLLNVNVIPTSSQELFTSLPDYLYGAGLNYSRTKWSLGLEGSQTKTKLDGDLVFAFKLSGSYKVARTWSLLATIGEVPSTVSDGSQGETQTVRLGAVRTF